MNGRHTPERISPDIIIDGDIHHPDDDPQGFDAGDTPNLPEYYETIAEADIPLVVSLQSYRKHQYEARKYYAKAQRSAGLEYRLASESDTRDIRPIESRRQEYMQQGDEHFRLAFGYEAMKAVALQEGVDLIEFDDQFTSARNALIKDNMGRRGEAQRNRLRRLVDEDDRAKRKKG